MDPNTWVPEKAPTACCREAANLGPFEQQGEGSGMSPTGRPLAMISGWRRCRVCQSRHFLMTPKPGQIGITGPHAPEHQ